MSETTPEKGIISPEQLFKDAAEQMARFEGFLGQTITDIEAGDLSATKGLAGQLRDLVKARDVVLQERIKLEEREREFSRSRAQGELDLDEARTEIGCRLARLRAARCPRQLS